MSKRRFMVQRLRLFFKMTSRGGWRGRLTSAPRRTAFDHDAAANPNRSLHSR